VLRTASRTGKTQVVSRTPLKIRAPAVLGSANSLTWAAHG
jgi:hypothetical protein